MNNQTEAQLSAKNIRRREKHKKFIYSSMELRSRIVGHTKLILSITAIFLLILILIWPAFEKKDNKLKLQFTSAPKGMDTETKMQKPSFFGVDSKNQPYNISGSSAVQIDKDTIEVGDIEGSLVFEDKSWISITAKKGTINVEKKLANLTGSVNFILNNGFEGSTESVDMDLKNSIAFGNTGVVFQGPPGVLTADNFEVRENGNRIILKNNVNLTINTDGN